MDRLSHDGMVAARILIAVAFVLNGPSESLTKAKPEIVR